MNLIRTTYFQLRTDAVFAYTVCCVHVAFIGSLEIQTLFYLIF